MRRTRLWILVVALLLAAGTIAACGGDDDDDGDEGTAAPAEIETIETGTLTVGSDIPFPPFEQGRAPNFEGFDIDIVDEIANRVDLEVQIEDTSFDTIFRDLAQGKFDLVASATTITPERQRTVDFSQPYYLAEQSLLVAEGSDIQSVDDLSGVTVGAQQGTTGADYADDETDAGQVRKFPEIDDAFNALQAGQVEAVINDLPSSQDAVNTKQGLEIVEQIDTGEQYGLPIPKESDALEEAVNAALTEMKDDGTYAEIYRKWFEKDPPEEIVGDTESPQSDGSGADSDSE